jgi:hypothetical protein
LSLDHIIPNLSANSSLAILIATHTSSKIQPRPLHEVVARKPRRGLSLLGNYIELAGKRLAFGLTANLVTAGIDGV